MLLNSKIDECFHIYKWSFSGGPTTINFPIPKWTFFRRMYSPFRTEIKDPGLDSSQKHQLSLHLQRAFFGYFFGIYILMLKVEYVFPSNNILSSLLCESLIWDGVGSPTLHQIPHPVIGQQWSVGSGRLGSDWSRAPTSAPLIGAASGRTGQDWPPAARHWSAVTTGMVRPARRQLSPTHLLVLLSCFPLHLLSFSLLPLLSSSSSPSCSSPPPFFFLSLGNVDRSQSLSISVWISQPKPIYIYTSNQLMRRTFKTQILKGASKSWLV